MSKNLIKEMQEAERKCRRDLYRFLLLCAIMFIICPVAIAFILSHKEQIDAFFDIKAQLIAFFSLIGVFVILWIVRLFRD